MPDAKEILKGFAQSIEAVIGSDSTTDLLQAITNFATECPETIKELEQLVVENPDVFGKLLTRQGVEEAKETIEMIKLYAPAFSAFAK